MAPSPSKAYGLQTESVFHLPPEAVHWGTHPSHHGKQDGHGTNSHGQVNCCFKWKLVELHQINGNPRQ